MQKIVNLFSLFVLLSLGHVIHGNVELKKSKEEQTEKKIAFLVEGNNYVDSWKLFKFNGRISRKVYFLGLLNSFLILGVLAVIFLFTFPPLLLSLFFLYPIFMWSISIKRFHDLGLSGWIYLLSVGLIFVIKLFIPPIGFVLPTVLTLFLLFYPGQKGRNAYGPNPIESLFIPIES